MPQNQTIRQVNEIEYILIRKPVKNINLRVYEDGRIIVSANSKVTLKRIDGFVQDNIDKIIAFLSKLEEKSVYRLIPKEYKSGEEFYFLGKKRVIEMSDTGNVFLKENTLYVPVADSEKLFINWLKEQAKTLLTEYVDKVYSEFKNYNVPYPQVSVRPMKTQWGSCRPNAGKISLNLYLLATPPECIYYVTVHEFAHFLHPNHSKYFWNVVARFVPDYKEKRKILRNYSAL